MLRRVLLSVPSLFLAALLGLSQVLVSPVASISAAWAAPSDHQPSQTHKKSAKGTPVSMMPATIQNIRLFSTAEHTRLVLDLDRPPKIKEHRSPSSDQVTLALKNVTLSPAAKQRVGSAISATPLIISQDGPKAVTVSFPTTVVRQYKHFLLHHPTRLVVDITPATPTTTAAPRVIPVAEDIRDTPSPALTPPPQPVVPAPKLYKTIVIDPGHGGKDPGARGQRGTEEKDITLKVALQLRELLRQQPGVQVLMTRDQDVFVELEDRAKFANSQNADLFISIHVNSHPSRAVKGIEIYHFGQAKDQRALEVAARENGTPLGSTDAGVNYILADLLTGKKIEESLELAWSTKESMVARMNGHYEVNDHGVKTAPFYVLRYTSMPSILAEIAYISNPSEETLLQKSAFIHDVAESLLSGVKTFLASGRLAAR